MTESSPKVSIVLPTYNGERYLQRAIESCLGQTHQNIELVVVDDCSTDSTPEIIQSFADPRLVYLRNQRNQGLPRGLNIGFARTTGQYLSWTSDDNEYAPTAIEEMLRALRDSPDAEFVYADLTALHESNGKTEARKLPEPPLLKQENTIGACFMYTRRVYEEIGNFDNRLALAEDYDYWIRVWKRFPMRDLDRDLYLYRFHSRSLTSTKLMEAYVVTGVVLYRHGLMTFAELTNNIYRQVSTVRNDYSVSEPFVLIAAMISRVWRYSVTLAIRSTLVVAVLWVVHKLRKLVGAVR